MLYGSLALTGRGHATDRAIILGLAGNLPATIDPDAADAQIGRISVSKRLKLGGASEIAFDEARNLHFHQRQRLEFHSNAMTFFSFDKESGELTRRTYFRSVAA